MFTNTWRILFLLLASLTVDCLSQVISYHSCTSNSDCRHFALSVCNSGICQPCSTNANCTHLEPTSQCLSSGSTKYCTLSCNSTSSPGVCAALNSLCLGSGSLTCGSCQSTLDCESQYPSGVECHSLDGIGYCGFCFDDDHCLSNHVCLNFKCIQCYADSDCSTERPRCHITLKSNTCKCLSDSDCPASKPTCTKRNYTDVEACYKLPTLMLQKGKAAEEVIFKFTKNMTLSKSIQNLLEIQLADVDTSLYSYQIIQTDAIAYKIVFKVNTNIPQTDLLLKILQTDLIIDDDGLQINQTDYVLKLDAISLLPESHKRSAEAISKASEILACVITSILVLAIFIKGDSVQLWMFISFLQANYYLLFLKVEYPLNIQLFLHALSISAFKTLPNVFSGLSSEEALPSPGGFAPNGVTGLFLINIGHLVFLWTIILISIVLISMLLRFISLPTNLRLFFTRFKHYMLWAGVLRLLICCFPEFAFASFLQLRTLSLDSGARIISSLLGVVGTLFVAAVPIFFFILLRKNANASPTIQKKFELLLSEYNHENKVGKHFLLTNLIKRLLMCIFITFLAESPFTVIIILITLDVISLTLVNLKPFRLRIHNLINNVFEVISLFTHILVLSLIIDEYGGQPEREIRIWTSWGITYTILVALSLSGFFALFEDFKAIQFLFAQVKRPTQRISKSESLYKRRVMKSSSPYEPSHLNPIPQLNPITRLSPSLEITQNESSMIDKTADRLPESHEIQPDLSNSHLHLWREDSITNGSSYLNKRRVMKTQSFLELPRLNPISQLNHMATFSSPFEITQNESKMDEKIPEKLPEIKETQPDLSNSNLELWREGSIINGSSQLNGSAFLEDSTFGKLPGEFKPIDRGRSFSFSLLGLKSLALSRKKSVNQPGE